MQVFRTMKNIKTRLICSFVFTMVIYMLYILGVDIKYFFCIFLTMTYILMLPEKVMNPKNIVFAYYFLFYVIPPLFANRYDTIQNFGIYVNQAYLLCFTTYEIIMVTLEFFLWFYGRGRHKEGKKLRLSKITWGLLVTFFLISISIYIHKTGGLHLWLVNANDAFFSRRGSGLYYLIFTNTLMILLFFEGVNTIKTRQGFVKRICCLMGLLAVSVFMGSRSTTFIMVMMLFADAVMNIKLISKKSVAMLFAGIGIFIGGLYIREKDVMHSASAVVSTSLNYFDTFENLMISLRDFPASFGKTVFLPLNWILMRAGTYINVPYHDMSIWLTTVYYPDSWINGGTTQWPLETDLYLSFFYYLGLPMVICYFAIIAYLYSKAQDKGIWRLIYLNEAMYIVSHLRGGLFIYWYFWLIPMYAWLVWRYGKRTGIKI